MNRFFSRSLSLLLAVLFLVGAAGVSFLAVFDGVTVFAATSGASASITDYVVGGKSVTAIREGDTVDEITVKIVDPLLTYAEYTASQKDYEIRLNSGFTSPSETIFHDADDAVKEKASYTITIKQPALDGTKDFKFEIDYGKTVNKTQDFSIRINLKSSSASYDISSVSFYDGSASKKFWQLSANRSYRMVVAVNDERFSVSDATAPDLIAEIINSSCFDSAKGMLLKDSLKKSASGSGVRYELEFPSVKYSGRGNQLSVGVTYDGISGAPGYTILPLRPYDLGDPPSSSSRDSRPDKDDDDSSSSRPDIAPPTPTIIVSEYDYGGSGVTAAGKFTLKLRFTNTSKKLPVDNIVVKIALPEALTLTSSSNTFYIEKLSKESSVEREIGLSVKPNAEPISHAIKLNFTFEAVISEQRKQLTSDQEISIPVSQLDRFSLNPIQVPPEFFVGESTSIEATFVNKGKTPVYNVTAEISGNIAQPGQRQFIGNVESGKEDSADFAIGADIPGEITGEIIITYEDANMNVRELREPFSTIAQTMEMPMGDQEAMNPQEPPEDLLLAWYQKMPVWGWAMGGVVLVIFAAFAVKLLRSRKEKKLLEEDDENF